MKLADCETIDDVIEFLKYKAKKQDMHLIEVEQAYNILIVTYGKVVPEKKKRKKKWHTLILSSKIKKDNERPMMFSRVKVDLAKIIEPYKSKKDYYDQMWLDALSWKKTLKL